MTHPSYASMSQLEADNAGLAMDDAVADKTAKEIQDEMVACIARDEYDYEGAMSDCHAAVDELAKCALRNDDRRAAWWLCANWAKRVNCYPMEQRDKLAAMASWHGKPPKEWQSWVSWLRRPEVAATHSVNLKP